MTMSELEEYNELTYRINRHTTCIRVQMNSGFPSIPGVGTEPKGRGGLLRGGGELDT